MLLPVWGWEQSTRAFLRYWFVSEHVLDEHLLSAIEQLRGQGIRCYIATNQEKYRTAYILNEMGLAGRFDGMFSSEHGASQKSRPTRARAWER